jgi:hypothetical protein
MSAITTRFPDLPKRLQKLPLNEKGYPVPFFVDWIDGKPDYRVIGPGKVKQAHVGKRCWICGEPMGSHKAFVIGPMCGVNRTISDPPSHLECATFAATHCPFMSRPLAQRNTKDLPTEIRPAAGHGLQRNPTATGVWVTKRYRAFVANHGNRGVLFTFDDPTEILWFAKGRPATRAEVDHSIDTGLPSLYELAEQQGDDALKALDGYVLHFRRMLDSDTRLNSTTVTAE